ncbi:MAG: bifunctional folylpolyglutamate synthase/dihydrofolate synthase [Candidatus Marinimicrobia bacterium]|nr:bifunctional folylpolyglutamate synthase/dihydrofolate synthase [Candidatus Neomarinimicrobiota bacterium]MBT3632655.1 bifunctional folylpolyglutamate synthase/dihydrofolate synthase [Candidatus Neomarinimicrobiota bacterium]MBT3823783.1 bifunctional folylpolyglutamate synthase/dihydrofolate synthase [Candidatus Neomarinimicrobiota bacterium]MBT4130765.1 bifunctional folylpolyglutamate synthase/dihydrofolate synthase [Candidatus Neomarinimicrobiota bacterium]MBT4294778.1 bifunctional folylpo
MSRVEDFMDRLGKPHTSYPIIHIAGTNGKGSTAAMLAAILNAYRKKTGLFTSPHLVRPNERIRVGNTLVSDEFIVQQVEDWRAHIDDLGITFFEVLTALGMEYFKQQSVEYAVIETGLGGRLDATNVVDPIVSVITNVSMDHENILGDNLTTIAGEKAGIIKPKRPTLLGKNSDVVRQVIEQKCQHVKAPFINVPDRVKIQQVVPQGLSQHVSIGVADKTLEIDLPLLGRHQVENFTNVLATLDELGFKLDAATIQKGLDEMIWLGRMQVLEKNHPVMYDVAHNPEGLDRLLESLNELDRGNTIIVAAFNARKNIRPMLDMLENWTGNVIFTIFAGHSAVERETLMHLGVNSDMISSNLENAYIRALELRSSEDQAICFIGSHYLAETLFPMFE